MEMNNNWRESLNKEWSKDFPTLTTEEVQKMLRLAFYQLFLIELNSMKITSEIDSYGMQVKFVLEGEAFKDGANGYTEDDIEEDGEE